VKRVFAAVTLAAATASAEPSKDDVARADALFRDAQLLMQKAQYPEACVLFAESQRLDPANGTVLNLALCHEKEGKTATAERELKELLAVLQTSKSADDRERARVAEGRLKALQKKLSFVVIEPAANVTLRLDGVAVDGSPVAVDLGTHTLVVSAPKKKTRTSTFEVDGPGTKTVRLEPLADDAPPPPPPAKPAPPSGFWTGDRVAGAALAGAGLVGLGVGALFGLETFDLRDERDARCVGTVCDPEGFGLHEDAKRSATISTIGFVAGSALLAVGVFLFVRAHPRAAAFAVPRAVRF